MHSTHHSLYEQHLHGGGSCGVSSIQAVVFYYHCDLRQETLEDLMSKSATLLFLTFDNIWIDKHRWPNTVNQEEEREEEKFRTSSSLTCPPVHKKVFQQQQQKFFKCHICCMITNKKN